VSLLGCDSVECAFASLTESKHCLMPSLHPLTRGRLVCPPRDRLEYCRKLKSSPTKDSAIRLPRSIDWDLIAEEDESDAVLLGAGPSQEHIQLALTRPNLGLMDELGKKPNLRPSAAFLTPGRDSALSERSTLAPDSGRYDPKLQTIQRRSPAMTILDRSLLRKQGVFAELEVDEKDFLTGACLDSFWRVSEKEYANQAGLHAIPC
jgi:hypothetical protein